MVELVQSSDPLWLVVSGFHAAILDLLDRLPHPRNVFWRIEYMGGECAPFVHSRDIDPASFTDCLLSTGHFVVPYSFNDWNRRNILARLPRLQGLALAIQPIAQKRCGRAVDVVGFRKSLAGAEDTLFIGIAGVYERPKGIDGLARWLIDFSQEIRWTALFTLITDELPETIKQRWLEGRGGYFHAQGSV